MYRFSSARTSGANATNGVKNLPRVETTRASPQSPRTWPSVAEAFGGQPREQQVRDATQRLLSGSKWKAHNPMVSNQMAGDAKAMARQVGDSASARHQTRVSTEAKRLVGGKVLTNAQLKSIESAVGEIERMPCSLTHFTRAVLRPEQHEGDPYLVLRSTSEQERNAGDATGAYHGSLSPMAREFQDSVRRFGQLAKLPVQNNLGEEDREGWGGANHVYFGLEPRSATGEGFKSASDLGTNRLTVNMEHEWMRDALGDGVVLFVDPMMAYEDLKLDTASVPPRLGSAENTVRGRQVATLADLCGHYLRAQGSTGVQGAMEAEEFGVFHSADELKQVVAQRVHAQVLMLERCIAEDIARLDGVNDPVVGWLKQQREELRALYQNPTTENLNALVNKIGLRPQVMVPTLVALPMHADLMNLHEGPPAARWSPHTSEN